MRGCEGPGNNTWWRNCFVHILLWSVLPPGLPGWYSSFVITSVLCYIMTTSNGNIFLVTGPLCRKFTGHLWIPRTKVSGVGLWYFLWSAPWINGWVNNHEAGDLKRYHAHYDVIVMVCNICCIGPCHYNLFGITSFRRVPFSSAPHNPWGICNPGIDLQGPDDRESVDYSK